MPTFVCVSLCACWAGKQDTEAHQALKGGCQCSVLPRLTTESHGDWHTCGTPHTPCASCLVCRVNVTAYNCTICQTAVPGSTFWGFVSAIINFNSLVNGTDSRLKELVTLGYNYEMKAQQPAGKTLMIAKYGPAPSDPVTATVYIPNGDWTLYVQPQAGWVPSWRDPMLAAVVVVGCLLGLLLTAILAGQHMQRLLLRETQVSGCCGVRRSQAKGVCRMLQLLYTPMLQVLSQMSPPWHECFCG